MRPAAVGFQCPACVSEGAKSTRAGRTAYGGLRPGDASRTSMVLIGLNVLVFLAITVAGERASGLIDLLALRPGSTFEGVVYPQWTSVAEGAFWQPLTSMFTHAGTLHIGFNMFALYVLGPQLELALGRARFLALYFLSGLAGSATVMWFSLSYGQTVGASGAIFGLMGALLVVAIKVGGDVRGLLTWIGINFVITFVFVNLISWQGHLGGFLGGLLIGSALVYAPREQRTLIQTAALTGIGVLLLIAIVGRVAILT